MSKRGRRVPSSNPPLIIGWGYPASKERDDTRHAFLPNGMSLCGLRQLSSAPLISQPKMVNHATNDQTPKPWCAACERTLKQRQWFRPMWHASDEGCAVDVHFRGEKLPDTTLMPAGMSIMGVVLPWPTVFLFRDLWVVTAYKQDYYVVGHLASWTVRYLGRSIRKGHLKPPSTTDEEVVYSD